MKKIKLLIMACLMFCSLAVFNPVNMVSAASDPYAICTDIPDSVACQNKNSSITTYIQSGINILLFVVGAVSVLMIILSGVYYVTSMGDSAKVKKAKDTLLYSVIGLIVAIMAYAIVGFVVSSFGANSNKDANTPASVSK